MKKSMRINILNLFSLYPLFSWSNTLDSCSCVEKVKKKSASVKEFFLKYPKIISRKVNFSIGKVCVWGGTGEGARNSFFGHNIDPCLELRQCSNKKMQNNVE